MNIVEETREDIIENNNTAQKEFASILETIEKTTKEIRIMRPLHGDLDLSLLQQSHPYVKIIEFTEGEITSIKNLPKGVVELKCKKNLLVKFENLPNTLEEIDVTDNYFTYFDFQNTPKLKIFRASNNQIDELLHIPDSIREIILNNNKLKYLDLAGLSQLTVLHVNNNTLLTIDNFPRDNVNGVFLDFQNENNPLLDIRRENENISDYDKKKTKNVIDEEGETEKKMDYIKALTDYFRIKGKYDAERLKKKRSAYERGLSPKTVMMKCIKCDKEGGTIFTTKEKHHRAFCGNTHNPCGLNIDLYSGDFISTDMIHKLKEQLEPLKEEFIDLKLKSLFRYIDEKTVAKKFQSKMEEYNVLNQYTANDIAYYNDLYNNQEKAKDIQKRQTRIHELLKDMEKMKTEHKKTNNKEIIRNMMLLYVHEIEPEIKAIRDLKYELCEVVWDDDEEKNRLIQHEISIYKLDYTFMGGKPHVVQWKI